MGLNDILGQILNRNRSINVDILPTRGLFYKDNFSISIKKADMEDIIEYEWKFDKTDVASVISRVKNIVKKNTILPKGYSFMDIKSADIVFLFLEIVKFTNNKPINIEYIDRMGSKDTIQFGESSFNYIYIDNETMSKYDTQTKEFIIEGFRFSAPSIGIENSITNFLISITKSNDIINYQKYSYDFIYFLGNRTDITFNEIENLIQIFNNDISDDDKETVSRIVNRFKQLSEYSLKNDKDIIEITSKINLENIWS
jgi:transposase